MLSLTKQITILSLLYETITCLTQPATSFFASQMKKTCLNHYKTLPNKETGNKHKATTMHKNKNLSDYIYSSATLQCKICLISIKTGQFKKLHKNS